MSSNPVQPKFILLKEIFRYFYFTKCEYISYVTFDVIYMNETEENPNYFILYTY